jgi:hypothetical protein
MPAGVPGKWQISTDGGNGSRWRRDGRELYFADVENGTLMAVDVAATPVFSRGPAQRLFALPSAISTAIGQYALGYDVDLNGQRFVTTFPSPDVPASAITVVMNWQSDLIK